MWRGGTPSHKLAIKLRHMAGAFDLETHLSGSKFFNDFFFHELMFSKLVSCSGYSSMKILSMKKANKLSGGLLSAFT
jgi:hypothetical protein